MPKGGARSHSGPPPAEHSQAKDRAAARAAKAAPGTPIRIDDGEWITLDRRGRTANAPAWPLTKASPRERAFWVKLWKLPQAVGWEHVGAEHQVATYVRTLVRAEEPESAIGLLNLIRLQQDGLGLTAVGLRMLRWKIGRSFVAASEPAATPTPTHPTAALGLKERMRLVSGDGSA